MMKTNKSLIQTMIHNQLDDIEIKTKVMVHNDTGISLQLRQWQDGELNDSYFKDFLNNYIDVLNGGIDELRG